MIHLALRTEFSFKHKHTYGRIEDLKPFVSNNCLSIGDVNGTYGFVPFESFCKKEKIKPIFCVRLMVLQDEKAKARAAYGPEFIFIAKNNAGYQEINSLVKTAFSRFYYKPFLLQSDVLKISKNVFVIAENFFSPERIDYIALTTTTPRMMLDWDIPKVAINNNYYPNAEDKQKYELLCGARKHGDSFRFLFNDQTYPMHILTQSEWRQLWKNDDAIENTYVIADQCEVSIPKAKIVKFSEPKNIRALCIQGAKEKGVTLNDQYKTQLDTELSVIKQKNFGDYFLIVADMVRFAKKSMLVGPSRGSCAGSLVCYLLDITTIDPIQHGLVFERFIDLNRDDLPDIDIDFPDDKRQQVIRYLINKYGKNNVCYIANINRMRADSVIHNVAMALSLPIFETAQLKEHVIKRTMGDPRERYAARDTLESTDAGRQFCAQYPAMRHAIALENHATHASRHAAGIIVANDEITKYCGVDTKENCIMMNKKDAENKNLLKIDVLGLRTLSILAEAAKLAGFDYKDYYSMPLDLPIVFDLFNSGRLSGIFQFEGSTVARLCRDINIERFNDISDIVALARPGPLHSGEAEKYVKRKTKQAPVVYICDHPIYVWNTEKTYGIIIYQEQLMNICRELAGMPWAEVSAIRKAASKTLGPEYLNTYKNSFVSGALKHSNVDEQTANKVWDTIITFGSWSMNKAHTVAYAMISYWCAFMKAKFPLEFAAANMNHIQSPESGLLFLRDMHENEGITYIDVDPDKSDVHWTVHNGQLLGGLTNIDGIAEKTAKDIVQKRKTGAPLTKSVYAKLISSPTPYSILYPCAHWWGDLYQRPEEYGIQKLTQLKDFSNCENNAEIVFLGRCIQKKMKDFNEYSELAKRNGKVMTKNNKNLKLVIEDDTGRIMAIVNRMNFEELNGVFWNEKITENETWLLVKGTVNSEFNLVFIKALFNLEELDYHGPNCFVSQRSQRHQILGDRIAT